MMDNPLPLEALQFAHAAYHVCGYCCLAGSAPLAKLLLHLKAITPEHKMSEGLRRVCANIDSRDVDVFVPQYPGRLKLDKQLSGGLMGSERLDFRLATIMDRHRVEEELASDQINVGHILEVAANLYGITARELPSEHMLYTDWNKYSRIGPFVCMNFSLSKGGVEISKPVQLILCDTFPQNDDSWHKHVVESFDIDVVRCTAVVDDETRLGAIQYNTTVYNDILQGQFSMEVQPGRRFIGILTRMQKYIKRGFKLKCMGFHSDCTTDYESYITGRFYHLYARRACLREFANNTGISNFEAVELVDDNMVRMFDLPSSLKQSLEFWEVWSSNMRLAHASRGWRSTGLGKIPPRIFEREVRRQWWAIHIRFIVRWYKRYRKVT